MQLVTKYPEITLELLERIRNHSYGRNLPPVRELSREFRVSSRTMQKALARLISGNWIIPGGRRGNRINYDKQARQRKGVICIFTNLLVNKDDPLIVILQNQIQAAGYQVIMAEFPDFEQMRQYHVVSRMPVDGFIFLYSTIRYQLCEALTLAEIPFVCMNRLPEGFPGAWCDFDYLMAYRLLLKEIFGRGIRRVAIHDLPSFSGRQDNLRAIWKTLMEEFSVPRRFRFPVLGGHEGKPLEEALKEHLRQWFNRRDKPELIFCNSGHSDFFLRHLKEHYHLDVPGDIQLLEKRSLRNAANAEGVGMVSMHLPYDQLAKGGWELLQRQFDGEAPGHISIPTQLTEINWDFAARKA